MKLTKPETKVRAFRLEIYAHFCILWCYFNTTNDKQNFIC